MIPYDELVAALASWRQRQGLPAGPADYIGEPAPARYDYAPAAGSGYGDDVVELSDDMMDSVVDEQSNPYEVEAEETFEQVAESDTQDEDIDAYLDSAIPAAPAKKPEPEPEPPPSGRRKRKR